MVILKLKNTSFLFLISNNWPIENGSSLCFFSGTLIEMLDAAWLLQ